MLKPFFNPHLKLNFAVDYSKVGNREMNHLGLQWYWIAIIITGSLLLIIGIFWVICKKCRGCT
jgi:hypothetical protein